MPCNGCGRSPTAAATPFVEVENDSALPFAAALTGRGSHRTARRRRADRGHRTRASAIVLPVGHRTSARVAISHRRGQRADTRLCTAVAPRGGWLTGGAGESARPARSAARRSRRRGPLRPPPRRVPAARMTRRVPCRRRRARPARCAAGPGCPMSRSPSGRPPGGTVAMRRSAPRRLAVAAATTGRGDIAARSLAGAATVSGAVSACRGPTIVRARVPRGGVDAVERSLVTAAVTSCPGACRRRGWARTSRSTDCRVRPLHALVRLRWHGERPAVLWEQTGHRSL